MTAQALTAKAHRALASAKLLLDSGDVEGACNRAYYAMFDAAGAALLSIQAPVPTEVVRTHSGLIAAFSLHLVKPGLIAVEHGRSLNKVGRPTPDCGLQGRPSVGGPCHLGSGAGE